MGCQVKGTVKHSAQSSKGHSQVKGVAKVSAQSSKEHSQVKCTVKWLQWTWTVMYSGQSSIVDTGRSSIVDSQVHILGNQVKLTIKYI